MDRDKIWLHLLSTITKARLCASLLDNTNGERDEIVKLCEHFERSAMWHKKQYE